MVFLTTPIKYFLSKLKSLGMVDLEYKANKHDITFSSSSKTMLMFL